MFAYPYSPLVTKILIVVVLFATTFWYGIHLHSRATDAEAKLVAEQEISAHLQSQLDNAKVNEKITIKYVDRVKTIQGKSNVIIKEIPKLVTVNANAGCVITDGFVSVFNSSVDNTVPISTGNPDATTSGIELSDVARTVAENNAVYYSTAAQLEELQNWVKGKLIENPSAGH